MNRRKVFTRNTKKLSDIQVALIKAGLAARMPVDPYKALGVPSGAPLDQRRNRKRAIRRSLQRLERYGLVELVYPREGAVVHFEVDRERLSRFLGE